MLRTLWTHHRIAVIVFAAACCIALVFAVRLALFSVYWSDPERRDAAIEGWQSPGYIAMSWKVPREVIAEALDLDEGARPRQSLARIAAARGVPVETLISDVKAAIAAVRADTP